MPERKRMEMICEQCQEIYWIGGVRPEEVLEDTGIILVAGSGSLADQIVSFADRHLDECVRASDRGKYGMGTWVCTDLDDPGYRLTWRRWVADGETRCHALLAGERFTNQWPHDMVGEANIDRWRRMVDKQRGDR